MDSTQASGVIQRERELKLGFHPEDLALLEASALILPASREEEPGSELHHLESVYFDTPDFDLARHGLELRVRRDGTGDWVQTLKIRRSGKGQGSGWFDRTECESTVDRPAVQLGDLPKGHGVGILHRKRVRQSLRAVFVTEVERRVYHVAGRNGGEVEMAIDVGKLSADRRSTPVCQLELEAKGEAPETLFQLAEALAESVDLRPETRGKADLGYELLCDAVPRRQDCDKPRVRLRTPREDVFNAIFEESLRQVRRSERMILEAGQAEGVHQMRVALRRMRAALSIFGGDLPSEKMNRVKQSLRGILEVLGPARDWDVLVATRLAAPGGSGAAGLVQAEVHRLAERERWIAWNRVCEFLKSRSFSRTLLELTGWISCRRWREGLSAKELRRFHRPVKAMALRTLRRGHQRLLQAGAGLAEAEDAAWHRVRIAMKRQRYFMESFRTCFPSKPVGRYVDALEELQDAFGALQDLAAGGVLLGEMAARHPGAVAVFVQGMLLAQERERNCLRTSALRRWPGFSELKCPWHDRG